MVGTASFPVSIRSRCDALCLHWLTKCRWTAHGLNQGQGACGPIDCGRCRNGGRGVDLLGRARRTVRPHILGLAGGLGAIGTRRRCDTCATRCYGCRQGYGGGSSPWSMFCAGVSQARLGLPPRSSILEWVMGVAVRSRTRIWRAYQQSHSLPPRHGRAHVGGGEL